MSRVQGIVVIVLLAIIAGGVVWYMCDTVATRHAVAVAVAEAKAAKRKRREEVQQARRGLPRLRSRYRTNFRPKQTGIREIPAGVQKAAADYAKWRAEQDRRNANP